MSKFKQHDRVRATENKNEIRANDAGIIIAAWSMANIGVRWDKDGQVRLINRKRLELIA